MDLMLEKERESDSDESQSSEKRQSLAEVTPPKGKKKRASACGHSDLESEGIGRKQ